MANADRDTRKQAFIESLSAGSTVTAAAEAAGVSREAAYKWRETDDAFAGRWAKCFVARSRGKGGRRQLRQIADDEGLEPGAFAIRRLRDDIDVVTRWDEYLRLEIVPPEFMGVSFEDFQLLVRREGASVEKRDLAIADRVYPSLKAVEMSGKDGGPIDHSIEVVFCKADAGEVPGET